ncbi:MAG TPA: hypothetical protein VMY76_05385 [Gemmatimonadales bacterium]|nr:hypothetical protein [Gemmatimonadales bacterium]
MRAFGRIRGQFAQVAADGVQLPLQSFLPRRLRFPMQQAADQAGYQVRTQREARRDITLTLVFAASPLQEWRVRQNIRRRLGLTEQLLRREQGRSSRWEWSG